MDNRPSRRRAIVAVLALLAATVVAGLLWIARDRAADISPWPTFEIGKELSEVPGVSIKAAFDGVGGGGTAFYEQHEASVRSHSSTFRKMLEYAYRIPKGGIVWKVHPPEGRFDLSAEVSSGGKDELASRLKEAFARVFRIRGSYEPREVPVLLLKMNGKHPGALRIVAGRDQSNNEWSDENGGGYEHRGTVERLVDWLQERLRAPVLDETGVVEDIEVSLSWKKDPEKDLLESLEKNGLTLEKAIRTVETLVISR